MSPRTADRSPQPRGCCTCQDSRCGSGGRSSGSPLRAGPGWEGRPGGGAGEGEPPPPGQSPPPNQRQASIREDLLEG